MSQILTEHELFGILNMIEGSIRVEKLSANTEEKLQKVLIDEEFFDYLLEMMCLEDYKLSSIASMFQKIDQEKTNSKQDRFISRISENKNLYNQVVNYYIYNYLLKNLKRIDKDNMTLLNSNDDIDGLELKYKEHPIISYKYTFAPESISDKGMHLHPGSIIIFKTEAMKKEDRETLIRSKIQYLQIISSYGGTQQVKSLANKLWELEINQIEGEEKNSQVLDIIKQLQQLTRDPGQNRSSSDIMCTKIVGEISELIERQISGLTIEEKKLIKISDDYYKFLEEQFGLNGTKSKKTINLPQETESVFSPQKVRVLTRKI